MSVTLSSLGIIKAIAIGQLAGSEEKIKKLDVEARALLARLFEIDRQLTLEIIERDRLQTILQASQ